MATEAKTDALKRGLATPNKTRPAENKPNSPTATGRQKAGYISSDPELLRDPEYRKRFEITVQNLVEVRYAPLFRILSLKDADLQALKSALLRRIFTSLDMTEAIRGATPLGSAVPREMREQQAKARIEDDAAIAEIIGSEGLKKFYEYEQSFVIRKQLSSFDSRLSYSDEPLQRDQLEQLISTISQVNAPSSSPLHNIASFNIDDSVLEKTATFLSIRQVEALRAWEQERIRYLTFQRTQRSPR